MKLNLLKSITSTKRLEESLEEVEKELLALQPEMEKLEKAQAKLRELKLAKQKLITLKLSLKSILENFNEIKDSGTLETSEAFRNFIQQNALMRPVSRDIPSFISPGVAAEPPESADCFQVFIAEEAITEASRILKQKHSLNFEIFRAIVFHGGRASTQQIKAYLIQNRIPQPSSGESFEQVELTDISSRVNYLVRKGAVAPEGRGRFVSLLGWRDPDDELSEEPQV